MDFSLPEDILKYKQKARQWVENVLNPLSKPLEDEEKLPDELVAELKKGRFFGLTIPEEYGGQGWGAVAWFAVLEELAKAYAKKRSTFGKPLSKRQAIQNNIAQMGTEIEAARLLAYKAAWKFDRGEDIVMEAAMAKLFGEQVLTRVAEMALRIHGGIGYTKAYPLERHFRDARSYHFEEGTEEIQKLLIARYLLM
jgi:acyl-CoA dehydrogenase